MDINKFEENVTKSITDAIGKSLPETINTLVSATLDAKMKELGMDKADAKAGNIPAQFLGIPQADLDKMTKSEKAAQFIKAVFRKDFGTLASMKAMTEGTDSAGGYLVPEEYAAEINRIAEDYGLVRKFARKLKMNTDTLNMPTLTTNVTVSWPGEATAGTASDLTLGRTQLLTKTLVGLTVLSNELLADANLDVTRILADLFGEAIAGEEDNQGLTGTGSPFTGILGNVSVNIITMATGKDTFSELDADDLRDMISAVKPLALNGSGFIMHRSIWGVIQKLKQNSQYIVSLAVPVIGKNGEAGMGGPAGTPVGTIWGYPVYLSEKMPAASATAVSTKYIIFGNLSHLWFGDRQQMTLDISNAATVGASNTFAANESAIRVTERVAIAVGLPAAFAVLKTAAS